MGPSVLGCLPRVFYMTVGGLAEGSDSVAHCTPVALEHLAEGLEEVVLQKGKLQGEI